MFEKDCEKRYKLIISYFTQEKEESIMSNALDVLTAWFEPRISKGMVTLGVAMLAVVGGVLCLGVYGFIYGHEHLYGVTREVPWGILISTYASFAIISTGLVLIAAMSHAFGGNPMAPVANRAVYLSIITIFSAFLSIGVELESPHRMLIYNIISPNLTSNIWWMGTLYGAAVGCMLVEFFGILSQKWRMALYVGVLGALAEVGANSNLGSVFGTLAARPFWYGAQLPVFFLCSAVMSGAACIILFTHIAYLLRGEQLDKKNFVALRTVAKVLSLTLFLIAIAVTWKMIIMFTGGEAAQKAAINLMKGPLSMNFWLFETVIGIILPLLLLVGTQVNNLAAMSTASVLALIGGFFQRYDLVVAGQSVPVFDGWDNLPSFMPYTPSTGEFFVVFGCICLTVGGFLLGERFFGKVFSISEH